MLELIGRIRERLGQGAYANEAAVSHGIVTPILNALGWDSANPDQLVPEYALGSGVPSKAIASCSSTPSIRASHCAC